MSAFEPRRPSRHRSRGHRGRVWIGLAIACAPFTGWAPAIGNIVDREADFDIAQQSVDTALLEFGRQADLQVMLEGRTASQRKTRGIVGRYSIERALIRLLGSSGLSFRVRGRTISVAPLSKNAGAGLGTR